MYRFETVTFQLLNEKVQNLIEFPRFYENLSERTPEQLHSVRFTFLNKKKIILNFLLSNTMDETLLRLSFSGIHKQ